MMHIDLCMYAFYLHFCTSELVLVKIISFDACCNKIDFSILAEHNCSVQIYVDACKCQCMYICMFIVESMWMRIWMLHQYNLPNLVVYNLDILITKNTASNSIVRLLSECQFSFYKFKR